jgi:hypothetical protein
VTFASRGAAGFPQAEQFGDDDVPSPVSASSSSLYLQVLTIDCETGQARAAEAVYLEPDDPVGLFGVLRQIPVARRFEDGARRIVRNLLARGGSI